MHPRLKQNKSQLKHSQIMTNYNTYLLQNVEHTYYDTHAITNIIRKCFINKGLEMPEIFMNYVYIM